MAAVLVAMACVVYRSEHGTVAMIKNMSVMIEGKEVSVEGMTEFQVIRLKATSRFLSDHSAKCDCHDCHEEMINDITDGWEN